MEVEDRKKYRIQVFIYRATLADDPFLKKGILLLHEDEIKYFNKNDYQDNYIIVMFEDRIVGLMKQIINVMSGKYFYGYDVQISDDLKKNYYFCEVDILLSNLEITKSKLPSDYKFIFQSGAKKIEKMKDLQGQKLKDIIAYPEDYIKKMYMKIGHNQYFRQKKAQEQTDSDDSNSSDESDDS